MARQCNVDVKERREAVLRLLRREEPLRANMTETLAPLFITVEGQEGSSRGKGYEQARAPGGQRP